MRFGRGKHATWTNRTVCYHGAAPEAMAGNEHPSAAPQEETAVLLDRARGGDAAALDHLMARHLPLLRRWASGRLPRWARDIADTTDLVHDTVIVALRHLDSFDHRGDGALQAYLRQGVINRIRNELRRRSTRGMPQSLDSAAVDDGTSPLEAAMATQTFERYEAAVARLRPHEREAVIARLEFHFSYEEIAEALGSPSANAARMAIVRAISRLAADMRRPG
jgi:RNA polymerase sigma factor (sigma-70 family)